ncbi:flippase [Candidatus Woesearchaeota archaeon]|nr:flippase [Candidatus Woesearchaeota archaeon]
MDTIRRISRNLFFQGISELTVKGLQILILIYIARLLRETEFGKFNFAIAFTTIALIFVDIGLQPLFVREISRKRELADKYIFHSIIIKSILSLVAFFVVIFILNIMAYPKDIRVVVYIMFAFTILKSFTDAFSSVFLAFEEMQWDGFLKILRAVLLAALVIYALQKGYALIVITWMYVITEVIVLSLCLIVLFTKFIKFVAKVERELIKRLTLEALPFAITVLFYSLYFYIDSVMLSKMRGLYEVGLYSAAYNLTIALIFIPTIYINAVFPSLSKFYVKSKESLKFAYKKSLLYMSVAALPITTVLFFSGSNIIHFLYGPGYGKSVLVLQIIAITVLFRFISFVNAITMVSIDRQKQRLYLQGITAGINIALNLILIPAYGYIGAAIATVATEFFLFISYFSPILNYFQNWGDSTTLVKPVIAAILASGFFFLSLNTPLKILLVFAVYLVLLVLLKAFKKEDWVIFKGVLSSAKPRKEAV